MRHTQAPYDARTRGFLGNRIVRFGPKAGAEFSTLGWTFATLPTVPAIGVDPISHPSLAATDFRTQLSRVRFDGGEAGNAAGIFTEEPIAWRGNAPGLGGALFSIRFAVPSSTTGARCFVGLSAATTAITPTDSPSAVQNTIGMAFDTDANPETGWTFIRWGEEVLGARVEPIVGAALDGHVYDLAIFCAPNASTMRVRVTDLTTGLILVRDQEFDTFLPEAGVFLSVHAEIWSDTVPVAIEIAMATLEVADGATSTRSLMGRDGLFSVRDFTGGGEASADGPLALTMSALGPKNALGSGATVWLPPAIYGLDEDVVIDQIMHLRGAAPGATTLSFASKCGLRVCSALNSPGLAGDAQGTVLSDLIIEGSDDAETQDVWTANEPYGLGDVVLPAAPRSERPHSSWEYAFQAVRAGMSGDTEPDFSTIDIPEPAGTKLWTGGTPYLLGDVVRAPGVLNRLFRCTVDGKSGDAAPDWNLTLYGTTSEAPSPVRWKTYPASDTLLTETVAEGTPVVWATKAFAGVTLLVVSGLDRVRVTGFLNAGVYVQGFIGTPEAPEFTQPGNANGGSSYEVQIEGCGVGWYVVGSEAQVNRAVGVLVSTSATEDRTFGVWDRTGAGNFFAGASVSSCAGPAFMTTTEVNDGLILGCRADATASINVHGSGQVFGGKLEPPGFIGIGDPASKLSTFGAFARNLWVPVSGTSVNGDDLTLIGSLADKPILYVASSSDANGLSALQYNDGWWTQLGGGDGGNALRIAGEQATDPAGSVHFVKGFFFGRDDGEMGRQGKRLVDITAEAWPPTESDLYKVGDIVFNKAAASGQPSYWQCIDDGDPDNLVWAIGYTLP